MKEGYTGKTLKGLLVLKFDLAFYCMHFRYDLNSWLGKFTVKIFFNSSISFIVPLSLCLFWTFPLPPRLFPAAHRAYTSVFALLAFEIELNQIKVVLYIYSFIKIYSFAQSVYC